MQKGTKSVIYWWKAYRKSGIEYIHINAGWTRVWFMVDCYLFYPSHCRICKVCGYIRFLGCKKSLSINFPIKFFFILIHSYFSFTAGWIFATLKTVSFYWISMEIFQVFALWGLKFKWEKFQCAVNIVSSHVKCVFIIQCITHLHNLPSIYLMHDWSFYILHTIA